MEKKRKLPARAAARSERLAKRRVITPREHSETPATPTAPEPASEAPSPAPCPSPPPPPLPTSVQAGKPLPTLEYAQPQDLASRDFQSFSESGVLAESLSRSRHRWLSDGLFEKHWTKPHKKKGVLIEDPKNPPKDSMYKLGTVTITIEPHIVEATMYAVRDPKPRASQPPQPQQSQGQQQHARPATQGTGPQSPNRPIIQYGPRKGSMPPPPVPKPVAARGVAPAADKVSSPIPSASSTTTSPGQTEPHSNRPSTETREPPRALPQELPPAPPIVASSSAAQSPGFPPPSPSSATSPAVAPIPTDPPIAPEARVKDETRFQDEMPRTSTPAKQLPHGPLHAGPSRSGPAPSGPAPHHPVSSNPTLAPSPAPPNPRANTVDPVIALLARKASNDPQLRTLMGKVAVGLAKDDELSQFQKLIDQLNVECKQRNAQQAVPAERMVVDGRTVKYFAQEVNAILEIVLATNPSQRSSELRPPPRSDPLVVLLVKTALEDQRTKDIIKRIAEERPGLHDAVDLKLTLERLHRDAKTTPQTPPAALQPRPIASNGAALNGHTPTTATQSPAPSSGSGQVRSKGPGQAPKPDISAVVFDFGSGDRYLFPKYSILEYVPMPSGQQVVASFLIVRKGSISDYGGDPKLDYYQPVTIRLFAHSGRVLENLARVVAPQEEVRRYMDDVMDNMTRAEYVLLAMRLPREAAMADEGDGPTKDVKEADARARVECEPDPSPGMRPSVLWTTGVPRPCHKRELLQPSNLVDAERETEAAYQRLISSVAARNVESV